MFKRAPTLAGLALLVLAAPAQAAIPHTVQTGETLWGIALQSNLTTRALATYNGLPEDGYAIEGTTIRVPTVAEAAAALAAADASAVAAPGTEDSQPAAAEPAAAGSRVVDWGDTLSGIAAEAGLSTEALAAANGLDPATVLLAGSTLTIPGAETSASTETPAAAEGDGYATAVDRAAAARQDATRHPIPTPGKVSSETVGGTASAHGVNPAFAAALAYNESGFENGLVSTADARGVMQILPSTWDWINTNLASAPLDPASPQENVHAGVMYLQHLLGQTGGDEALAAASYYQGLASVQRDGLFEDTKQYVDTVFSLKPQFGG